MSTDTPSATVLLSRLLARARLRHLHLFIKLAELGNLKRSAEALHLSQPAATQLLADLEQLVGVRLFERHARGVRATPASEALQPAVRRALDALADASESLTSIRLQAQGVVRVAALTSAVSGWLVRSLPAFAQTEPGIQIQVQECEADRCAELVSRQQVDVALCREPQPLPGGCTFHPRLADNWVVACGPQHPLTRRKTVQWATVARERWLMSPVQSGARRAFDERMALLGATPAVSTVVTRVSGLTWAMLQGDRLLTLVPYGVVRQLVEAGQLAIVPVQPSLPFSPLGWLLNDAAVSQATRRFLDHLDQFTRLHP
jgi:DNA-binding transcriptional LysR family regulator